MSLSIGIIGLPNVGKSTLFAALTKKQVNISSYPFCTIDPNVGVAEVPDKRLNQLAQVLKPSQILPTTIEFVDIAGLVKNAHQGEGLGNQFLSHIREVNAMVEVIRSFKDANIAHVAGKIDLEADKETINLELIMADLATVEKRLTKITKEAKSDDKELIKLKNILEKLNKTLVSGQSASQAELSKEENLLIQNLNLLTTKPILYLLNSNEAVRREKFAPADNCLVLNIQQEKELTELNKDEQTELGLMPQLDQLIKASYKLLNLITFFTVQNKILQAWAIKQGTKAPLAAGKIHTDMEKGFIRAEIINWQKLIEAGEEQNAQEKGLMKTKGKDYVIQDGDICRFLFKK